MSVRQQLKVIRQAYKEDTFNLSEWQEFLVTYLITCLRRKTVRRIRRKASAKD